MRFLDRISIKNKMILFSAFIVLIFSGFGLVSITQSDVIYNITETIYSHPLEVSNAAQRVNTNIAKINAELKSLLLAENALESNIAIQNIRHYDEAVLSDLELIELNILGEEGQDLHEETAALYISWDSIRQSVVTAVGNGDFEEAEVIVKTSNDSFVRLMEMKVNELREYAFGKADEFILESTTVRDATHQLLYISLLSSILVIIAATVYIVYTVNRSVLYLKNRMDNIAQGGELLEAKDMGSKEIRDMTKSFNVLIRSLRDKISHRDGIQELLSILDFDKPLTKNLNESLTFLSDYSEVDSILYYDYNKNTEVLELAGSHLHSNTRQLKRIFKMGEGVVGQAARSRKEVSISGERVSHRIVSAIGEIHIDYIYAAPVIFNQMLIGVMVVNSTKEVPEAIREFLEAARGELGTFIDGFMRRQRINQLLTDTQKANETIKNQARNMKRINIEMEEKQTELRQQTTMLNEANYELEEKQQELEMQTKELQRSNYELEELKNELVESNKLLKQTDRFKSEFLTNMSHELRTPLNSIILLSSLLRKNNDKSLSESDIKKADVINKAGQELLNLIDDLLDLSKIESGKISIHPHEFNFKNMLNNIKDIFAEMAKEKNVELKVSNRIRRNVISDEERINQIIINLLSNALKFTEDGEVKLEVRYESKEELPIVIEVTDTGIGIPDDKRELIFKEFMQADGSISRRFGGTGLGLAICNNLATLLGGKIDVHSTEGKGSTFTVRLNNIESSPQKAVVDDRPRIQTSDKVVLVVEDDLEFANEIKSEINSYGYQMVHAPNGREGLSLANDNSFDGIILDLLLPDMSGEEVLHTLKTNVNTRKIPTFIVTKKDIKNDNAFYNDGAIAVMSKGNDPKADIRGVMDKLVEFIAKNKHSLLIVEDNQAEQLKLRELLTDDLYTYDIVDNIKDAKKMLKDNSYDVAIVDLILGNDSGLDLCKHIKQKKYRLPTILYTAKDLLDKEAIEVEKYSDSIIIKTVNSHGRLLEELSMLVNTKQHPKAFEGEETFANKKVLVCDDDAKNIFSISSVLETMGVSVIEAFNGQEALDRLDEEPDIDLILMDIMMPVMDGIEAITKIRSNSDTADIPIIAVTAKAMKGDKQSFIEAGATDYVSKPVDFDILIKLLGIWLK